MKYKVTLSLLIAALTFTSCTVDENGNMVFEMEPSSTSSSRKGVASTSKYYSKGHYVYVNESLLDSLKPSNSRIEIDLSSQRARVYKTDGTRSKLVIETQISTGKSGRTTPTGKFRILEKSPTKRSNLYGKWVNASSGDVITSNGDSREPPKSRNAKFQGARMPYWLRLTGGGVGMHIGYVPNAPASHGCIRVPSKVQPLIYRKVRVGTPVTIVN